MMVTGLVVMLRVDEAEGEKGPPCVAVNLALKQDQGKPVVVWQVVSAETSGRVSLDEIAAVNAEPDPGTLGYDLAARSFVVVPRSGPDLLFHAENKDICALVVDGLQMLVKDHRRRARKSHELRKKSLGKKGKPKAARKPLGNANAAEA